MHAPHLTPSQRRCYRWTMLNRLRASSWFRRLAPSRWQRPGDADDPTVPKWQSGLLLACSTCGDKLQREAPPGAPDPSALGLQRWLKDELRRLGRWGPVRVASCSCMGFCPKGSMAVVLVRPGAEVRARLVHPVTDRAALLAWLQQL